jgi:hypothetical protein
LSEIVGKFPEEKIEEWKKRVNSNNDFTPDYTPNSCEPQSFFAKYVPKCFTTS